MDGKRFIDDWLDCQKPNETCPNLIVLSERANTRALVIPAVCAAVKDHLIGLAVIEKIGGYRKAASVIQNRLPTRKAIRSGDLGEILATEYVEQKTDYRVPIRRLRYKDDRQMAMRGDDVIAVRVGKSKGTQVLKVEAKSRASLTTSTIKEASEALVKNSARPNPSTLAFISVRLRELDRHSEAMIIERLQQHDVRDADIEHLIFTFSGNNPANLLVPHAKTPHRPVIARHLVGVVINDHQNFIKLIFESVQ
jgi:hypothetical protein